MAPKRAFGGVLRPFGGGFRGPNRERASVFSGAGRGRAGGSAVEPGRDQRVQRWGPVRDGGGTGGGSAAQAGAGPACSAERDRAVQVVLRWSPEAEPACSAAQDGGGTGGGSAVEPGRGQRVQRRGIGAGRGVQRCRRDGPAAGSQKKCSEGKMRPPPGRKKSVPKGRCARRQDAKKVFRREDAPPPEHIRAQKKRTSVRSLLFLLHYSATLRASAPGCSSDTPCRTTTAPHSGSPSLLRETSGSMFSCNSLSAFDFGLPAGRGSQP